MSTDPVRTLTSADSELDAQTQRITELEHELATCRLSVQGLRTQIDEYGRFFTLSLDMLCIADFDGYFRNLNPAWTEILGYEPEELMAQPFLSFVHPDDQEATIKEASRLPTGEDSISFENRYRCKDGSYKWLLWQSKSVPEERAIYAIARDITTRKHTELALAEQAQLLHLTHDAIFVRQLNGTITFWNRGAELMYGFSAEKAVGQSSHNVLSTEFPIPLAEIDAHLVAHGRWEGELVHTCQDGRVLVVTSRWVLQRGDDGEPIAVMEINTDITARRQAEDTLRERETLLQTLLDSTQAVIYAKDMDSRLILVNRQLELAVGASRNDVLGKNDHDMLPREVADAIRANDLEVLQTGMPIEREEEIYVAGELHTYISLKFPLYDAHNVLIGLGGVSTDITERKRAEAEQVQLREEIIRTQAAIVAELSTPLIPISDTVMVMPLIGSVDSRRAQAIMETLLEGVSRYHPQVVILDITGVPLVDTQVANAFVRAAQAVQLLGAQVVLTGVRAEVAQTLVGLGVDLRGIVTRSSLQSGIAYAMPRR